MNVLNPEIAAEPPGFNFHDAFFVIRRHKWKITLCTLLGVAAAVAAVLLPKPVYASYAKLLVRYVVDTSSADSWDPQARTSTASNDNVINTEVEILTSWDLAMHVAENVTAQRLLPQAKEKATNLDAARVVASGLKVNANHGSNVIWVSYESADPELASLVLSEVINRYLEMHLEVHRPSAGFETLTQQSDQMRLRLTQTDEQLKQLKEQAGIVSLEQSMTSLNTRISRGQQDLSDAETELATQKARLSNLENALSAAPVEKPQKAPAEATPEVIHQYRVLLSQLDDLRRIRLDLSGKFTPESTKVRLNEDLISRLEKQRQDLEAKWPALLSVAPTGTGSPAAVLPDLVTERSRLASLQAKVDILKKKVQENETLFNKFTDTAMQISQLERRKQLEEENAKYFDVSLEKARIDESLNPSKMPNINIVQKPSPAGKKLGDTKKSALGFAAGGLLLGLALAFLNEMVLDRSVKRPVELDRLNIPLTLTIPLMTPEPVGRREASQEASAGALVKATRKLDVAPWEQEHCMREYCDAIRDRLELYFQSMAHKPKLIAVAGLSNGSGASTLSAGLAAALSKTAEGRVLFVDMNLESTHMHPFLDGRPATPLADAIQLDTPIHSAADNLYLATAIVREEDASMPLIKRFHNLIPKMKGSDFDYLVFDLPPFGPTSPTLALAALMDQTILVVAAENDQQETLKEVYAELQTRRATVSVVLNKVPPKSLKRAA